MRPDFKKASTDGFVLNWHAVLLKLCEPFTRNYDKIDRIHPEYTRHPQCLLDLEEETRILASPDDVKAFQEAGFGNGKEEEERKQEPEVNFITHSFFLACALQHYALQGCIKRFGRVEDGVRHLTQEVREMEASAAGGQPDPMGASMIEVTRMQLKGIKLTDLTYRSYLFDDQMLSQSLSFSAFTLTWLTRMARGTDGEGLTSFPWPDKVPSSFSTLPEYLIEDALEIYIFTLRIVPTNLPFLPLEEVVAFSVTFLANPMYIRNPYLKAKLVEVSVCGKKGRRWIERGRGRERGRDRERETLFHFLSSSLVDPLLPYVSLPGTRDGRGHQHSQHSSLGPRTPSPLAHAILCGCRADRDE